MRVRNEDVTKDLKDLLSTQQLSLYNMHTENLVWARWANAEDWGNFPSKKVANQQSTFAQGL